jgi:sortase A
MGEKLFSLLDNNEAEASESATRTGGWGRKQAVPDARTARERRLRRRQLTDRFVVSALVLAALVFALLPVAGTYWSNYQAFRIAQEDAATAAAKPESVQKQQMDRAHAYNAALKPSTMFVPIGANPLSNAEYKDYLSQLSAGPSMGTIRIPSLKVTLPIGHGTGDKVLSAGAGHVYGTSLPVGGTSTHTGISAHSALAQMTAFDRIDQMGMGDVFYIDVLGETFAYKVTAIDKVLPNQMDKLKVVAGKDLATLITCTPYGINSHRLLVTGERIPYEAAHDSKSLLKSFDWTIQDWMWMRILVSAAALLFWIVCAAFWIKADVKRRRERKASKTGIAAAPAAGSP